MGKELEVIEAEYAQTELEVAQSTGIVRAAGDISVAMTEYTRVKNTLDRALPDCIMNIRGKQFRKKNYWRAVATAFNLDVVCIEKGKVELPNGDWGVEVTYRATAPNGRCADGDGACMASEKSGNMATYHNIRAHAHTRGFNRSVSNLVGFGEVSYDELQGGVDGTGTDTGGAPPPPPAAPQAPPRAMSHAAPSPQPAGFPQKCVKCGGTEFWDNRDRKRTPRSPDFRCKNKDCGHGVWLNSKEENDRAAQQQQSATQSLKSIFDAQPEGDAFHEEADLF
jgi:hypothetical protein